ncbi:GNAT family N-acetyltransferase [Actinomadura craniellae]|uniref:GNAT family N-acetyltransferase n=1 Tax=Actinomadura craniellae TaxID=2231787 RepID=A0A365H5V5_9ACTN|nr:GNAT family N-acetyltransferase [Actinomadura craniellae]
MFEDVLAVADSGRFLPYDKDRRWSATKDERVLVDAIVHQPDFTIVPTMSVRGGGLIKLHHYARHDPALAELGKLGQALAHEHGAEAGHRIIWFSERPDHARTRLMVKTFTDADEQAVAGVDELEDSAGADTFGAFADEIGPEGFQFLCQRMKAGHRDGPVLVTVADGRIIGAVGPLSVLPGPDRRMIQPPAYFAVHPAYRGRGHGRRLWRASMAWGWRSGAEAKVLQASIGSAAERLYRTEGLETVGFLCQG